MNLARLTSTTSGHPGSPTARAGNTAARVRPVDHGERTQPDRDQESPRFILHPLPAEEAQALAERMARRARELLATILRLGPAANRLIKPERITRRQWPVDEEA